jgi:hypothetical protein
MQWYLSRSFCTQPAIPSEVTEHVPSITEQRRGTCVAYYNIESVESAGSSLKREPATGK